MSPQGGEQAEYRPNLRATADGRRARAWVLTCGKPRWAVAWLRMRLSIRVTLSSAPARLALGPSILDRRGCVAIHQIATGYLGDQSRCKISKADVAEADYTAFTSKNAIT